MLVVVRSQSLLVMARVLLAASAAQSLCPLVWVQVVLAVRLG
jgi:hypothetical protein